MNYEVCLHRRLFRAVNHDMGDKVCLVSINPDGLKVVTADL